MDLLVVGAGEMGRWIADTVRAADSDGDASVTFTDLEADRARDAAISREGTRSIPVDAIEASSTTFEVVCLAVPISTVPAVVDTYEPVTEHAMIDVSGAMTEPIEAMRDHLDETIERASFHPLFAPPRVPGNVAVVIDEPGPHVQEVIAAIEAGGNDVFETTAAEHDDAMRTVQAGAHAAILAWRLAGDDVREEFHTPVSAVLDDLADTVTEGAPEVYAEIQRAFDGATGVADAAREIADADFEDFTRLYDQAREEDVRRDRHE